ncbi:MerR family transcriptional regulator [Virgibacillus pantothenticus]|uniref:MerR family transcriptional regulator n=1 Tax=Virgibacillus pantothenticus TaxID=1473 RepID=A0A0L0QKA7_VIRPA|nr:MerR family transcriptional regulator [Virgibacillus pantothenticus]KNE18959.1 MerR family transcriptional regulator [Virgibacillus pantothenticus]MED3736437.1 MerR family transcriptional regulator [Virgibacillus pantothenticus]QTY15384.1 MerR family transcriptional regulator [Virgibacillus pantothenticus]SIS81897.1 DNA-binding transcriptional regulator, MerR family [Virgibacillus pantothenticus]GIP63465.1 MerR family transcriptional regulator [Virgibacillus pantothenticus]
MQVKEVADLVGISIRTLHHYDAIGLLKPQHTTRAGYRIYTDSELERLQQILFFKELGFPLKNIKEILDNPSFDQVEALEKHRERLLAKRRQIDTMLETIQKTIRHTKGELTMSNQERFAGFDFSSNPYEQEARERWGDKAVDKANANINELNKRENLEQTINDLYHRLAAIRKEDPASEIAQKRIGEWFHLLNEIGTYSLDAFKGLGQMYVEDDRFRKNIDQFGEGLASFMRDAMVIYADSK